MLCVGPPARKDTLGCVDPRSQAVSAAAFSESAAAFAAMAADHSAAPALELTVGNNSHGYINKTRLALYDFLSRRLLSRLDGGVELSPTQIFSFEQLRATSTGSVVTAPELNQGRGSLTAHAAFVRPIADRRLARLRASRARPDFARSVR